MSGRKRWTHLDQMIGEGRIRDQGQRESAIAVGHREDSIQRGTSVKKTKKGRTVTSYHARNYEAVCKCGELMLSNDE